MPASFAELSGFGFVATHQINLDHDQRLRFEPLTGSAVPPDSPAVYLWLMHEEGAAEGHVLYVGKAGYGIARRCAQHQSGLAHRSTGRRNAEALTRILSKDELRVTVMTRSSEVHDVFGVTVSLYAAEEAALYARYSPSLNRAAFPEVYAPLLNPTQAPQEVDADPLSEGSMHRIQAHMDRWLFAAEDVAALEDAREQISAYDVKTLAQIERLLEFLEEGVLGEAHSLRIIGGFANQPPGCNNVTTLGYGRVARRNFAPHGWVARIYLADAPRIGFPRGKLLPKAVDHVDVTDTVFSPRDLNAFVANPSDFLIADRSVTGSASVPMVDLSWRLR